MSNMIAPINGHIFECLPLELSQLAYAVFNKVQSPPSIIVTSILSTLSSAIQGYVDVEPLYGGVQPVALYTLVIAESGERKTSTDRLIMKPLHEHEQYILKQMQDLQVEKEVEALVWKAKIKQVSGLLVKAIQEGHSSEVEILQRQLTALKQQGEPKVKTYRSILNDATSAALFRALAGEEKSITLHSSDAGNLLTRANMDFIANANQLWDGEDVVISRVVAGESEIKSARLTLSLMLQPAVLSRIFKKKDDVLRLSGYFARMLVTQPHSTQGERFSAGASSSDEGYIDKFHQVVKALLKEAGYYQASKERITLTLSPAARNELLRLQNWVEIELRESGSLFDVREAGSKIVNNATRIAALLHVYANRGVALTEIGVEEAYLACYLASSYLSEYRRIFGEKPLWEEAEEYGLVLYRWLDRHLQRGDRFAVAELLQYGPNSLRTKAKRDLALMDLEARGHILHYKSDKHAYLVWLA